MGRGKAIGKVCRTATMAGDTKTMPKGQDTTMSKIAIFNVSQSQNGPKYEGLKLTVGATPSDEAWQDLNMTEADVNEAAVDSVVIKVQGALRRNWPKTAEEAQAMVDNWAAGRRASYTVRVSEADQKVLGFSPEQVAFLKSQGVQF